MICPRQAGTLPIPRKLTEKSVRTLPKNTTTNNSSKPIKVGFLDGFYNNITIDIVSYGQKNSLSPNYGERLFMSYYFSAVPHILQEIAQGFLKPDAINPEPDLFADLLRLEDICFAQYF